jgi:hypothetical protein
MDDLELLQQKTLKDKLIYWCSYLLGIVGTLWLIWDFIRVRP